MTKITLTWQKDETHKESFNEVIELPDHEISLKASIEERVQSIVTPSKKPFALGRPTRIAVGLTLESGIDELLIIRAFLNEPVSGSCDELLQYKTLRERFTLTKKTKQRLQEEEYEKIPFTDSLKLRDDISFLCTTFRQTIQEVLETGLYTTLLRVIFAVKQQDEDSTQLEVDQQLKQTELNNLKKLLIQEKYEYEKELERAAELLGNLKTEYEDILGYGKEELRYLEDWEESRHYQNDIILNAKEDIFNNTINGCKTKVDLENRVHNEIGNFILENTEDLQDGIQYWMHHYDDEIERRDTEIYNKKMEWERLTEDHVKLGELYEEHKLAIEEWLTYKEEKRKREELEALQNRAAIKIQAWWRGTMVRKKLGPYRKKKKGKDKGKDKKGKGKKK